jgi:hypothetical protein
MELVSPGANRQERMYYGAVFEIKRNIPVKTLDNVH